MTRSSRKSLVLVGALSLAALLPASRASADYVQCVDIKISARGAPR